MEMELITGGNLPTITSNFDELKAEIVSRLEKYKIEVTEENLAQAKKDATELGKAATQLNKIKTDKAKEFSLPIDEFKEKIMGLVGMILEEQEHIKKQVKVFEDKTREACRLAMIVALRGDYLTIGVRPEYQTSIKTVGELAGISKIKPSGELTKAASDAVFALAAEDRGRQDRVDHRISKWR